MRLGIVGHGAEKFTPATEAEAKETIADVIADYGATAIVSGHSPMGGIDIWAEEAASQFQLKPFIYAPKVFQWDPPGEYGYKARNLDIARNSDLVLCIVVRELPPGYAGEDFGLCYHCKGRNPDHVKSGGCWTAWQSKGRGWLII